MKALILNVIIHCSIVYFMFWAVGLTCWSSGTTMEKVQDAHEVMNNVETNFQLASIVTDTVLQTEHYKQKLKLN